MSEQYEEMFERWRQQCEQLQAKFERLRNLQPADITPEELEAVNEESDTFVWKRIIAAVCRGMLGEVGGDG